MLKVYVISQSLVVEAESMEEAVSKVQIESGNQVYCAYHSVGTVISNVTYGMLLALTRSLMDAHVGWNVIQTTIGACLKTLDIAMTDAIVLLV